MFVHGLHHVSIHPTPDGTQRRRTARQLSLSPSLRHSAAAARRRRTVADWPSFHVRLYRIDARPRLPCSGSSNSTPACEVLTINSAHFPSPHLRGSHFITLLVLFIHLFVRAVHCASTISTSVVMEVSETGWLDRVGRNVVDRKSRRGKGE